MSPDILEMSGDFWEISGDIGEMSADIGGMSGDIALQKSTFSKCLQTFRHRPRRIADVDG